MKCYCNDCFERRAVKYERTQNALYMFSAFIVMIWATVVVVAAAL